MQTLYHRATELPGHITNNPPPETLLGYTLPRALQIRPQISFGEIQEFLISFHDIQTKPPHHSGLFMLGAICNRWKVVALTQGLSLTVRTLSLTYRATRSYHQQSSTWNPTRLQYYLWLQFPVTILFMVTTSAPNMRRQHCRQIRDVE